MLSKNEVKYIQSLCHKKQRQEDTVFIVEGPKLMEEVLSSNYAIKKIYAVEEWLSDNRQLEALVTLVTTDELQRITGLQTANKVIAIVAQKPTNEQPVFKGKLTLMLDGIQDPGNLGTMIRIADWFGITQIVCSNNTVELYNPKVIQSTMGSFVRVKMWYTDLQLSIENIKVPVFGALLKGENVYTINKPKEGVLLIGSEGKGISNNLMTAITHPITIPRIGGAES